MLVHIRVLARNRGILLVRILIEARRESLGRRKIGEVRSEGGGRLEGGGMGQRKGKRRGLRMPRECRSWYHDRTIPLCVKSRNQIVYLDAECSFVFKGCAPEPHDAQAQITSGGEGDVHLHAHGIASDFACKHAHRAMHLHNPSTFERLNLIRPHVLVTRGGTRGTARRPGDPADEAPPREDPPDVAAGEAPPQEDQPEGALLEAPDVTGGAFGASVKRRI